MGLKDKMADKWFGNMDPKERQETMDSLMDHFFSKMSAEERTKMMETMMKKFMGGQESPMAGMMDRMMGHGGPMRDMMSKMMACGGEEKEGQSPWDMCRKMMATVGRASDLASFATPEVRGLFEEWAAQIEEEILHFIQESKTTDADAIAARFKLSKNSANYFLSRLSQQGKISLKAEKTAGK